MRGGKIISDKRDEEGKVMWGVIKLDQDPVGMGYVRWSEISSEWDNIYHVR